MTRKDMEQILSAKKEIKAIEASMTCPKSAYVSAFYIDYSSGVGIPRSESGYDYGIADLEALGRRLENQKAKLRKLLVKAEKFVENIDDSETRTIVRAYYINGQSQEEIGDLLNYDRSTISRKLNLFWELRL